MRLILWVTGWSPCSAPLGQGSLQNPNFQHPGPEGKQAKEGAGERPSGRFAKESQSCTGGGPLLHREEGSCWQGHNRATAGEDSDSHGRCQQWSSQRTPAIA